MKSKFHEAEEIDKQRFIYFTNMDRTSQSILNYFRLFNVTKPYRFHIFLMKFLCLLRIHFLRIWYSCNFPVSNNNNLWNLICDEMLCIQFVLKKQCIIVSEKRKPFESTYIEHWLCFYSYLCMLLIDSHFINLTYVKLIFRKRPFMIFAIWKVSQMGETLPKIIFSNSYIEHKRELFNVLNRA